MTTRRWETKPEVPARGLSGRGRCVSAGFREEARLGSPEPARPRRSRFKRGEEVESVARAGKQK